MGFSSQFTRPIRRMCTRIGAVTALVPALLVAIGFSSAAMASTVNGGTFSTLGQCQTAGNLDLVVTTQYKSYTCVGSYDGPKGNDTAVWTLYLTTK